MAAPQEQNAPFRIVDKFPLWYVAVKWLLPISLALMVGLTVGLAITGVLPIPAMMGKAAWLPAVYASLDTVKAAGLLVGLSGTLGAVVGLVASFVLRATVLFQINEHLATQGQKAQEALDLMHKKGQQLEQLLADAEAKINPKRDSSDSESLDSSSEDEDANPPITPARSRRRAAVIPDAAQKAKPKPTARETRSRKKAA